MSNKVKKCYIYTRVSTAMQVEGFSLDAQRERLLKEAKHRDMKVVGEFSDEGKSGKNTEDRPEFMRMMRNILNKTDDVDYVLVFKLSRFGRNTADILNNVQIMQDYGVNLLCVEDGIDSAGASGKLMISVMSAVAEIERENILIQTMEGRKQKAREGKWNGGFAPYGYELVDEELKIVEDEAEVIRVIYQKFGMENYGMARVAKWLNANGYKKKIRQNGTTELFSTAFVKGVLDNPVYAGKIAYGRRKNEKIEGARNKYHIVKQQEYDIFEGKHEAIVSEELWVIVAQKRSETGIKQDKIYSKEHEHLLSGILKCPICGSAMYGSVNRKKKKDGTYYKDMFYYTCKHKKLVDGKSCTFGRQPQQKTIDEEVEHMIISCLDNAVFVDAMEEQLIHRMDDKEIKKRVKELQRKKTQVEGTKRKLAEQIDKLDVTDKLYDIKYEDLQNRLDKVYSEIYLIDDELKKAESDLSSLNDIQATRENAYNMIKVLQAKFGELDDVRKKVAYSELLDRVELFEDKQPNGRWVKSIHFKFPVCIDGVVSKDWYAADNDGNIWWEKENHDETVVQLVRKKPDTYIDITVDMDELDLTSSEAKATYDEIKDYIFDTHRVKVSSLYIAQVKQMHGIIERDCYNNSKKENPNQPQCPPEKVKLIEEALRHFKMIP